MSENEGEKSQAGMINFAALWHLRQQKTRLLHKRQDSKKYKRPFCLVWRLIRLLLSQVERELHRQELLRERSRKATEEKRLDEERARAREREQRRRQEDEEREAERRRREQVRRQEAEREEEEMRQRRRERAAMALSPRKQIKVSEHI